MEVRAISIQDLVADTSRLIMESFCFPANARSDFVILYISEDAYAGAP